VRNYRAADALVQIRELGHGRISVAMQGMWLDAPSVALYRETSDAGVDRKTEFAFREASAGASARVQATRFVAVGAGLDSVAIQTDGPLDPTYRRSRLFAEFDSRRSPGFTRRGGLYRLDWSDYRQTHAGSSSFRRLDAEVKQFVPILRENWVIALRALASSTSTSAGNDVPVFLMPDLGGSHTLRGYSAWRFRGRSRMLLTGEYRWTAGPFADMAIFLDAGKVAARFSDLDLRGLKTSYGLGVTFHAFERTALRAEIARTREGNSLVLGFSPSF